MARTVEAILKANTSQFDAAIDASGAKMDQLAARAAAAGAKVDASLSKAGVSASKLGTVTAAGSTAAAAGLAKTSVASAKLGSAFAGIEKHKATLDKTARGLTVVGAAALTGFGYAVKSAADFDEAMSHVNATGEASTEQMGKLRKAAIDLGASTQYSATQVASAEEELLKAGVSAAETLEGGLVGALNLAAAGGLSVASSATIAGTALKQFELSGKDIPHVADLLAAGANAAVGSVEDLASGLKYVGPVAHGMGVSIDQTVGALTEFAAAGLVGEQGGTALRGVLLSLTSPSEVAAKEISKLGINLYDAKGKFVGVDGAAQQLQDSFRGLSEAERNQSLGRIFGNTQITAANILMRGGASDVNSYTDAVNKQGAAAEQARKRMDNLKGDVEKLSGSLQTAFISGGEGVQSPFRNITEGLTGLVDGFNNASTAKQHFATDIVGIAGAGALAAAGVIKIAQAASSAKVALAALKISAATAGIATAGIAAGLVIGALAFEHYAKKAAETRQNVSDMTDALVQSNGAIDASIVTMRAKSLVDTGAADAAGLLGINTTDLAQASLGNADAQARVNAVLDKQDAITRKLGPQLASAANRQDGLGDATNKVREAIKGGNVALDEGLKKYRLQTEITTALTGASVGLTDAQLKAYQAYNAVGASLDALTGPLTLTVQQSQQLSQSLFTGGQAAISASNAHIGYKQAVTAANEAIKKNGDTLSENTTKGQANKQALNQLAASGQGYVQSLVAQGASSKVAAAATGDVRAAFIKTAEAAGKTKKQAGALADAYGLVPKNVSTTFDAFGLALQQTKVEEFKTALQGLTEPQRIKVEAIFNDKGAKAAQHYLHDVIGKTVVKPKIDLQGADKSKKAAAEVGKAIHNTGEQNARPRITPPSTAAKKRADDTTGALKKTGAQNAAPRIKDPGGAAKKRADDATSALKTTGRTNPSPRINVSSNAGSVASSAKRAMQIPDTHAKIIVSKVIHNTTSGSENSAGGGNQKRADGGSITGYSPHPKADNIPIMATAREFVQPVASVDYYGGNAMEAIRQRRIPRDVLQGYANGGLIGGSPQHLASGGSVVDIGRLVQLIAALNNPLALLAASTRKVAIAQAASNVENRKVAAPKNALTAATVRLTAAQKSKTSDQAEQLAIRKHNDLLKKRADATKGVTKADREYKRGQQELTKITRTISGETQRITALTKKHTAAQNAYNKVSEKAKAAADKLKEAQSELAQQQQAVAETARQVASTLTATADTTSTDPLDVLAKKKETAAGLVTFNKQLLALRKAGLNDTQVNDIVGRGSQDGGELATAILKGGKGLVDALNLAQNNLDKAANAVGLTAATTVIKRADGGEIHGPGGRRGDRIHVMGSDDEFMINARSNAANRGLVKAINDGNGRNITADLIRGTHAFGGYGMGSTSIDHSKTVTMPIHVDHMGSTDDQILNKVRYTVQSGLVSAGLI